MASIFDLQSSIDQAQLRLGGSRKKHCDSGEFRLKTEVVAELRSLLAGEEYPGVAEVRATLTRKRLPCPSRATIYAFMQRAPGPAFHMATLPEAAQAALYNLDPATRSDAISGAQLAFYCFNHGDLAAVHFAAGLPWLALYQAYRLRGWRPRSLGLLRAVLAARSIPGG